MTDRKSASIHSLQKRIDARNQAALQRKAAVDAEVDRLSRIGNPTLPAPGEGEPAYAGASPVMVNGRIYAEPGGQGVPNVTVIFYNGQCAVTTERSATLPMQYVIQLAAKTLGEEMHVERWTEQDALKLHQTVVRWLRTEWNVGRVSLVDGAWHYRRDDVDSE